MKEFDDYMKLNNYYYDPKNEVVYKETTELISIGDGVYDVNRHFANIEDTYEKHNYHNTGLKTINANDAKIGTGGYKIVIEPSIKEINGLKPERAKDRIAFEYGLSEMLNPDNIRENALKVGEDVKKQYIYFRIANAGEKLAATRPYIGMLEIKDGKTRINQKGNKNYAKEEVKRVEEKIRTSRLYTVKEWEEKYLEMEAIVEAESEKYRKEGEKEKKIKDYTLGMIKGKTLDLSKIRSEEPKKQTKGRYVPKHQKNGRKEER